jgi:hypothetical protein
MMPQIHILMLHISLNKLILKVQWHTLNGTIFFQFDCALANMLNCCIYIVTLILPHASVRSLFRPATFMFLDGATVRMMDGGNPSSASAESMQIFR